MSNGAVQTATKETTYSEQPASQESGEGATTMDTAKKGLLEAF
jgi:hypothetical protein